MNKADQRIFKLEALRNRRAEIKDQLGLAEKFGARVMTVAGASYEAASAVLSGTPISEETPSRLRGNAYGANPEHMVARKIWAAIGVVTVAAGLYGGEKIANTIKDNVLACSG